MALLTHRHNKPRYGVGFVLLAVAAAFVCAPAQRAEAQRGASIDEVKAAFVFQFANYITWPEDAFADASSSFTIGIVGNSDIAALLRESTSNKSVGGHPVLIREITSPNDAAQCQILFLDRRDDKQVDEYLGAVAGKPVLTVSDDDNFTERGGIIKLYEEQNKLRIEVNVDESDKSKLVISSKLLGLAKVVRNHA
jgi:hypothetical protein